MVDVLFSALLTTQHCNALHCTTACSLSLSTYRSTTRAPCFRPDVHSRSYSTHSLHFRPSAFCRTAHMYCNNPFRYRNDHKEQTRLRRIALRPLFGLRSQWIEITNHLVLLDSLKSTRSDTRELRDATNCTSTTTYNKCWLAVAGWSRRWKQKVQDLNAQLAGF